MEELHQLTKAENDIYPTTLPRCIPWKDGTLADLLVSIDGISFPELSENVRIAIETLNNLATINGIPITNGGDIVISGGGFGSLPMFRVDYETGYLIADEATENSLYHFTVDKDGYLCVEYI